MFSPFVSLVHRVGKFDPLPGRNVLLMCTRSAARDHHAAKEIEACLGTAVAQLGLGQVRAVVVHAVITLQYRYVFLRGISGTVVNRSSFVINVDLFPAQWDIHLQHPLERFRRTVSWHLLSKTVPFPLAINCLLWCFPNGNPKYVKMHVFSVNTAAALDPSARNSALQTQLASSRCLSLCSIGNKHFNTALLNAKEQLTLLLRACFWAWMNPKMGWIYCQMGVLVWTTV